MPTWAEAISAVRGALEVIGFLRRKVERAEVDALKTKLLDHFHDTQDKSAGLYTASVKHLLRGFVITRQQVAAAERALGELYDEKKLDRRGRQYFVYGRDINPAITWRPPWMR